MRYQYYQKGGCHVAKVDKAVKAETIYIAVWVLILSALMQAVFLLIGRWDYTVLCGNLLGGGAAVLNFFLMGLGVQKAVTQDEQTARSTIKLSQTGRLMMMLGFAVIGLVVPVFHPIAVLVPMLFPRIAIALRPVVDRIRNR